MRKPNNSVILKLPFQGRGFFSFRIKRKIGFVFDNHVAHMVFIASETKTAKEFKEWSELENGAVRNFEFMYQAAVRYREKIRKSDNFSRITLKRALLNADDEQIKLLSDCIKRSEMYGATPKKKVKAKKQRPTKSMSSV